MIDMEKMRDIAYWTKDEDAKKAIYDLLGEVKSLRKNRVDVLAAFRQEMEELRSYAEDGILGTQLKFGIEIARLEKMIQQKEKD